MSTRHQTTSKCLSITSVLVATTLCAALATEARAACSTTSGNAPFAGMGVQAGARHASYLETSTQSGSRDRIVGMWLSEFLIGEGPDRFDLGFQQFHGDGTETMLSSGLPPSLGNVCLGIWKQVAPRTVQLRHVAWNWNADGSFAGTFVMSVTLRVSRRGDTLEGTWSADSFDPANNVIPELHGAGVVRGTRITVD